ncbi:MAG: hypothetical protein AAFN59_03360 [Pseudomonadota bacterium]
MFAKPLSQRLLATGLGTVTGAHKRYAKSGEGHAVAIDLALVRPDLATLKAVAILLEDLDAPLGSSIFFTETGTTHLFGRTEGLGIFIDATTPEETRYDLLEACSDALGADAIYQGSATVGESHILYFYGDSFNTMQNALSYAMRHDPRCHGAFARRLT